MEDDPMIEIIQDGPESAHSVAPQDLSDADLDNWLLVGSSAAIAEWARRQAAQLNKFNIDEPRDERGRWSLVGAVEHAADELAAAQHLNKGKRLDPSDPVHARLKKSILAWANGGTEGGKLHVEMQDAVEDPGMDTDGAAFLRTIAGAPPNSPELYRGMHGISPDDLPKAGDVFALGPTSFTRSTKVRDTFAQPPFHDLGRGTVVNMTLVKNSRSLRVDREVPDAYAHEQEHVTLGKFRVSRVTTQETEMFAQDGHKRRVTIYRIEIAQVPDTENVTIHMARQAISGEGW